MASTARKYTLVLVLGALFVLGFTVYLTLSRSDRGGQLAAHPWPEAGAWARAQLGRLPLEARVSQLFTTYASGRYMSLDDPAYRRLVDLTERFGVGGLLFVDGEPFAQAALINTLQARSPVPLLVAQDVEQGPGMHVAGATTLPPPLALGAARDTDLAYAAGALTGQEARALGTSQVFAHAAHLTGAARDVALADALTAALVRGLRDAGVLATVRHPAGETNAEALAPLRAAVDAGVTAVLTGPLLPSPPAAGAGPALPVQTATLQRLREQVGFRGLLVTPVSGDAAGADARPADLADAGEAAVRALEAGADMLVATDDLYALRAAVLEAVASGRLSEQRINESALRVLLAKEWLRLPENRYTALERIRENVATDPHQSLSETIARASLTLLRNEYDLLPLTGPPRRLLVLTISEDDAPETGAPFTAAVRRQTDAALVRTLHLDGRAAPADLDLATAEAANHDVVLVALFGDAPGEAPRLADRRRALLNRLVSTRRPVVVVNFGPPNGLSGVEPPAALVVAYGAAPASQQAAAEALFGRSPFHGRLPVDLPGLYAYGDGLQLDQVALREGHPSEVGMHRERLYAIDSLMRAGIAARAFPGAAVAVGRGKVAPLLKGYGHFTYDAGPAVTPQSRFDLASLTKVVATTTAIMKLYEAGKIDLDAPVSRYLSEMRRPDKEKITVRQLLTHSGGLIPFRPYHTLGLRTRDEVLKAIFNEPLAYAPGTDSRYSDHSMIILSLVVERLTGRPFAAYVHDEIFAPLGMWATGFRPVGQPFDPDIVPTELDRVFRRRLLQGEVHDEVAYLLGGVSGHAGLFSTAEDLARFASMLVSEGRYNGKTFLKPETIALFTTKSNSRHTRALGWDTRSPEGYSSAGQRLGPQAFGHTGYTGTSLWIDPEQDLFVILLTNRVYPTRDNQGHVPIRPALADIAYDAIAGPPRPALPRVPRGGR